MNPGKKKKSEKMTEAEKIKNKINGKVEQIKKDFDSQNQKRNNQRAEIEKTKMLSEKNIEEKMDI